MIFYDKKFCLFLISFFIYNYQLFPSDQKILTSALELSATLNESVKPSLKTPSSDDELSPVSLSPLSPVIGKAKKIIPPPPPLPIKKIAQKIKIEDLTVKPKKVLPVAKLEEKLETLVLDKAKRLDFEKSLGVEHGSVKNPKFKLDLLNTRIHLASGLDRLEVLEYIAAVEKLDLYQPNKERIDKMLKWLKIVDKDTDEKFNDDFE